MKKFVLGFIIGALLFSILPVSAAIQEYICYKADYKVFVNGVEYTNEDLPVLNYKGNTYAPFRSILEAAGLVVNWNAKLKQAEVTTPVMQEREGKIVDNTDINIPDFHSISIPKEIIINDLNTMEISDKNGIQVMSYEGIEYVSIKELRDKEIYMAFVGNGNYSVFKSEADMEKLVNPILENVPYSIIRWGDGIEDHMVYITYNYYISSILPAFKETE
jgi:hypothetical protein